ncbi:hypothetical protein D3C81_1914890 [compost metagenome]
MGLWMASVHVFPPGRIKVSALPMLHSSTVMSGMILSPPIVVTSVFSLATVTIVDGDSPFL